MKCIKCKDKINARRLKALPQTKVCVNCSTAEAVSCVDVIYHKTEVCKMDGQGINLNCLKCADYTKDGRDHCDNCEVVLCEK